MYTIVLLIYLQSGRAVNLIGSTVTGEFPTKAACESESLRKRGALPIPKSYDAAWQDSMCVKIDNDVRVGNDRATAFEKALHEALEPDACAAEGACRRADIKSKK